MNWIEIPLRESVQDFVDSSIWRYARKQIETYLDKCLDDLLWDSIEINLTSQIEDAVGDFPSGSIWVEVYHFMYYYDKFAQ